MEMTLLSHQLSIYYNSALGLPVSSAVGSARILAEVPEGTFTRFTEEAQGGLRVGFPQVLHSSALVSPERQTLAHMLPLLPPHHLQTKLINYLLPRLDETLGAILTLQV